MILGNKNIIDRIPAYVSMDNPGGLLLLGPKGVGKYTVAKDIAWQLLNGRESNKSIDSFLSSHPDFIEVKGDKTIKLEDIHDLISLTAYAPNKGQFKVFLIDNADSMTVGAQNALLKVLEDSSDKNIFLIVSHKPLLPTIHSRMTIFQFQPINEIELNRYLIRQGVPKEELQFYCTISAGSIGNYNNLVENKELISDLKSIISYFDAIAEKEDIFHIFKAFKEKDNAAFLKKYPENIETLFILLEDMFYGLFLYHSEGIPSNLMDYASLSTIYDEYDCIKILLLIREERERLRRNSLGTNDFFSFLLKTCE